MNVLSLFDGISCGQVAFKRLGIEFGNERERERESNRYFASEINKYAIQVTQKNFPNTIKIGDIRNVHYENGTLYKNCEYKSQKWYLGNEIAKVDFDYIIGGSPCQNFSFAGKANGMTTKSNEKVVTLEHYLELKDQGYEFDGYSYLFWEYIRLLNEVKPKYFLLENVRMKKEWECVLNDVIGFEPTKIDSALVSAQTRKRLYWVGKKVSNNYEKIEVPQPLDRGLILKDILDYENDNNEYVPYGVEKRYKEFANKNDYIPQHFLAYNHKDITKKTNTITTRSSGGSGSGSIENILPICLNSKSGRNGIEGLQPKRVGLYPNNKNELKNSQGNRIYSEDYKACTQVGNAGGKGAKTGLYAIKTKIPYYEIKDGFITINDNKFPIKLADGYYIIRKLSPLECERLQTLDDNYTDCVSNNQRYKCIGNGWTVEVIKHILSYTLN